jgi:hypothetical protein
VTEGAMKRKLFILTDSNGRDSSDEAEMIAQIKEEIFSQI